MSQNRFYSNTAVKTSLNGGINNTQTSMIVNSVSGFPASTPYTLILERDTANEEVVTVTAVAGTTLTVTRGADSTSAVSHASGATVEHGVSARDFNEPQAHIAASSGVHGLTGTVVGTTDTQTLTNKTLTSPAIATPTFSGASAFPNGSIDANGFPLLRKPFASAYNNLNSSVPNATWTAIPLNTTVGSYGFTLSGSRAIATVAGYYRVSTQTRWTGNGTGVRLLQVCKNSGGVANTNLLAFASMIPNGGNDNGLCVVAMVQLAANDYVEAFAYQSSGAGLTPDSTGPDGQRLDIEYVSAL